MFVSFFPRPKIFFLSVIVWTALAMTLWYSFAAELIGSSASGGVGVDIFWSARSLWFDLYFVLFVAIFAGFWMWFAPHPWALWSIAGSALILFGTYFQVQVSVAINSWFGPFYDMIQAALSKTRPVTLPEFYGYLSTFASIARPNGSRTIVCLPFLPVRLRLYCTSSPPRPLLSVPAKPITCDATESCGYARFSSG